MPRPLRIDAEAEEELAEAVTWYEQRQKGLGREFLIAIGEATERIRETPQQAGRVPGVPEHVPVRRMLVRRFPYSVVFLELPAEIRVLAFAHAKRRPGYWRERSE